MHADHQTIGHGGGQPGGKIKGFGGVFDRTGRVERLRQIGTREQGLHQGGGGRSDPRDTRAQALAPHQGVFTLAIAQALRRIFQAGRTKQVRRNQARHGVGAGDHGGAGGERERQALRVLLPEARETGQIRPGIGCARGTVQGPFGARHVAQVGRVGELIIALQKAGQGIAPQSQVTALRWMAVPQVAGQQREVVVADQRRDHWVGRV